MSDTIPLHMKMLFSFTATCPTKVSFALLFTEYVSIFLSEDVLIDFTGDIVELFAPELHANP